MRALTVQPGQADSLAVEDIDEPTAGPDEMRVAGLAIGVCGTDKEIAAGAYGWAPPGRDRLVLGHESLGRVLSAPDGSDFIEGDLVVGVVRRPDPVPCGACAHGEFDMCRNGRYTERGIKEIDGYGSEIWCVETDYAVKLDDALAEVGMLMEPTTVVAKAWNRCTASGSGPGSNRAPRWSPALARSVCSRPSWASSTVWKSTCWTGSRTGPNQASWTT